MSRRCGMPAIACVSVALTACLEAPGPEADCVDSEFINTCPPSPTGAMELTGPAKYSVDTDSGMWTGLMAQREPPPFVQQSDPLGLIVIVESLHLAEGAMLRVQGSRPLIIYATNAIVIDGVIDVSSSSGRGPWGRLGCRVPDARCRSRTGRRQ